MGGKTFRSIDPLFKMFEHFLATRSYEDSAAFTKQLAEQYMAYLDSTPAHVPFHIRASVIETLESEAHELLVKKMYGCVRAADYANIGSVMKVKTNDELTPLDFHPVGIVDEEAPKKGR